MLDINKLHNSVHFGDCLEVLKLIPDKSIDCILVDLPYQTTNAHWDSLIPLDLLWAHYKRIIKDKKPIVLFGAQPFTSKLINSNIKQYKYSWIWQKSCPTNFLNAKHQPLRNTEDICIFSNGKTVYNPQMRQGKLHKRATKGNKLGGSIYNDFSNRVETVSDLYYPTQILEFKGAYKPIHPTQKPVELLEYLIKTYSNENDIILDSCAGSGSTLIAARNLNRIFIGIEKDEDYYSAIIDRLNKGVI